jgi:type IVB pilus formation R64 PilN family outer membrane protein
MAQHLLPTDLTQQGLPMTQFAYRLAPLAQMLTMRAIGVGAMIAVLTGCQTQQKIQEVHQLADSQAQGLNVRAKAQVIDSEAERLAQQDVARPYLVGRPVPLAREVAMPAPLRKRVTVLFDRGGVDLLTAARQISEAAGIVISVSQDAMLPAAMFAPRLPAGGAQGAQAANPGAILGASSGRVLLSTIGSDIVLFNLLDEVARQAGVSWRPAGAGAEFYRTETRVFRINTSSQTASSSATLGRNSTANAVFEAQSKTGFSLEKQDPLQGMRQAVEALLTSGGRLTVAAESQTFVVTDTPEALARVAAYVDDMNKGLARRVRLVVEAIEVTAKDTAQYGLDWSIIYKSLASTGGGTPSFNLTPITTLTGANALSATVSATAGRFAGSTVAVRALSEVGTIVNRKSFPFVTTSGRPVTTALRNTFNYVDSASVVQSSTLTTSQPAPTVTQKEETVGTFLTVSPVAKDNGQIFLTISYDVTSADPLTSYTVGSAGNSVTVQQKSINGTGIVQEVPMRSGQTVVVGGYDSVVGNLTQRRIAPGAPMLPGSDAGTYQKSIVVILVTAVAEEGY